MELSKKYSTVWDYIEQSMSAGPLRDDLLKLRDETTQLEAENERLRELSIALYRKIESSPDVCNLDEFDAWEKALGGE